MLAFGIHSGMSSTLEIPHTCASALLNMSWTIHDEVFGEMWHLSLATAFVRLLS